MERVGEMIVTLESEMNRLKSSRIKELIQLFQTKRDSIQKQMTDIFTRLIDEHTDCIVISYLRSSYITGSHKFRIASYRGEPFVDEYIKDIYYCLDFFNIVTEDIHILESILEKQYIRVLRSEMEEIRRCYMNNLYRNSEEYFRLAVNSKGSINTSRSVNIYFGEDMGEVVEIGYIAEILQQIY